MKISVLITYYNQREFVRRSLESVLRQRTFHEVEVLVGDDGSSDGTRDVVAEYEGAHAGKIRMFVMPRDAAKRYDPIARVTENRLRLLAEASGEAVCFLDGDDFYLDDGFLETGAEALAAHPYCSGCMFGHAAIPDEGQAAGVLFSSAEGLVSPAAYLPARYVHAGAMLFRKPPVGKKLAALAAKKVFDDNLITFLMLNHGPLYHIPRLVYGYRQHESGIWGGSLLVEHHILNALDFNIARKTLPAEAAPYAYLRYFKPLSYLYANKEGLSGLLGEELRQKYILKARNMGCRFIAALLDWDALPARQRRLALAYYRAFRSRAREIQAAPA